MNKKIILYYQNCLFKNFNQPLDQVPKIME